MEHKKTEVRDLRSYLVLAGVLFAAGLFFLLALQGYDTLGFASFALCALVMTYFGLRLLDNTQPKLSGVIRKIVTYGFVLFALVFAITEGALAIGSEPDVDKESEKAIQADYLIVLGAGVNGTEPSPSLTERLRAALSYLEEYPDTVCIVSGGQGGGEDITEAECMSRWLTENGIDENRIILEEQATNTYENLRYSLAILEERGDRDNASIAVLTSEYHILRAKLMAKDMGANVTGVTAKTENMLLRANYYAREALALWKYLIFG